jgi:hypothetical protein
MRTVLQHLDPIAAVVPMAARRSERHSMSDDKRYDSDSSTPVFDQTAGGQPPVGTSSGHDGGRRDDAVTGLGDEVGAYADITDPDATAADFSATAAPVVAPSAGVGGSSTTGDDGSSSDGGSDAGAKEKAKAKADSAKEEAAGVAGDAKSAASDVVGSAKEQASKVASEATGQAKELFGQATSELKEQAGAQQEKAAAGLRTMGDHLGSMADNGESGVAGELVRNLSGRAHGVAEWLEGRDAGTLLDDVKSFAARKPGTFIAIAAASGLLAGRVVKSLTAEAKHQHEVADQAGTGTDTTGSAGGAATQTAPATSTGAQTPLVGDAGPVAGEYDVVEQGELPDVIAAPGNPSATPGTWPGAAGTRL